MDLYHKVEAPICALGWPGDYVQTQQVKGAHRGQYHRNECTVTMEKGCNSLNK